MGKQKESSLHWFKFKVLRWNTGDIQDVSYHLKGVFSDLIAYYWSRQCDVSVAQANKKFKDGNINNLRQAGVVKVDGDKLVIEFLNEQWADVIETSLENSKKANKRWGKDESTGNATAYPQQSRSNANKKREDTEENREEEIEIPRANSQRPNLKDAFFQDLPNSTHLNDVASELNVTGEELRAKIPEFRTGCRSEYFKMSEFVDHFKFWYRKNFLMGFGDQKTKSKDEAITNSYLRQREQIEKKHNQ